MKSGWYENEYYAIRPLHNGKAQQLVMIAHPYGKYHCYIMLGVFSCHSTAKSIYNSQVWKQISNTNKHPSLDVLPLALDCLAECERAVKENSEGRQITMMIDGMDERRLRVYTKVLIQRAGYKIAYAKSQWVQGAHQLKKVL